MAPMDVYFVLLPRFLLLDFAGPAEAFRLANEEGARFGLTFIGPVASVESSLGLSVGNLQALPPVLPDEALLVLSGSTESALDYQRPEALALIRWLRETAGPRQHLACICSAALLAAKAGLLDGRRCTTHHSLIETLREAAPQARVEDDRIFVEDGPVATSAGITAGIDLALYLIERHAGAPIAQRVAREMVVYLRRNGLDPQLSPWLAHRNHLHPGVHRAQDLIGEAPRQDWSLQTLAESVHMSVRNLSRLFREHAGVSVNDYLQSIRLAHARQLLENSAHSVERVAELSGFASARDFRRVWGRHVGGTPRAARQMD